MNKEEIIQCLKAVITYDKGEGVPIVQYDNQFLLDKEDIETLLDYINQIEEELEKADSITQSCIFLGKEESTMNFRTLLNELEKTKKEKNKLETNRDEVIEYAKGYFTKATSFNPYVVIEKLERGKE